HARAGGGRGGRRRGRGGGGARTCGPPPPPPGPPPPPPPAPPPPPPPPCPPPPCNVQHTLSGFVYSDTNADGQFNNGDTAISGVVVVLTGTQTGGAKVTLTATTAADGSYSFKNLNAGTYALDEQQPNGFLDGHD